MQTLRMNTSRLLSAITLCLASACGPNLYDEIDLMPAPTIYTEGGLDQPLFEQRLSLTRSAVVHPFELEIARSSAGITRKWL